MLWTTFTQLKFEVVSKYSRLLSSPEHILSTRALIAATCDALCQARFVSPSFCMNNLRQRKIQPSISLSPLYVPDSIIRGYGYAGCLTFLTAARSQTPMMHYLILSYLDRGCSFPRTISFTLGTSKLHLNFDRLLSTSFIVVVLAAQQLVTRRM